MHTRIQDGGTHRLTSSACAALALVLARSVFGAAPAPPLTTPTPVDVASFELPTFQQGMWEYHRTVSTSARGMPQHGTVRKCSDPTHDIRQKLLEMKQKGCTFAPPYHSGNRYRLSWVCPVHAGTLSMTDMITAKSDVSYDDLNELRYLQRRTRTAVTATRIGQCPLLPLPSAPPAEH